MITLYDIVLWSCGFLAGVGVTLALVHCFPRKLRIDHNFRSLHQVVVNHRQIPDDSGDEWKKDFHA